ncbi:hypothetical protein KAR91_54215 [Candidatus Pacearchaeota archaeon]|nr:hypothetical protein [Candidatus Pacearchaeota archaeon]
MKKAERLECRRKFLFRFSRLILSDEQYDDIAYDIPRRDLDNSSVITIVIVRGPRYYKLAWDLREISHPVNIKGQNPNKLIRCRLNDALWHMKDLEEEDRLNKK